MWVPRGFNKVLGALTSHSGALFCLHSALIGITAAGMLAYEAGGEKNPRMKSMKSIHKLT